MTCLAASRSTEPTEPILAAGRPSKRRLAAGPLQVMWPALLWAAKALAVIAALLLLVDLLPASRRLGPQAGRTSPADPREALFDDIVGSAAKSRPWIRVRSAGAIGGDALTAPLPVAEPRPAGRVSATWQVTVPHAGQWQLSAHVPAELAGPNRVVRLKVDRRSERGTAQRVVLPRGGWGHLGRPMRLEPGLAEATVTFDAAVPYPVVLDALRLDAVREDR